jgi:hypothetical protein
VKTSRWSGGGYVHLDEVDRHSRDADIGGIHASLGAAVTEAMEEHHAAAAAHGGTTGRREAIVARLDPGNVGLGVRAIDRGCRGIAHVVRGIRVAVGRVEQDVDALVQDEIRRLDQRAVAVVSVQYLDRIAHRGNGVVGDLLQHDRRCHQGCHSVVAVPSVADTVPIDLVRHVASAVLVEKARGIDGTALSQGACERRSRWNVRPRWIGPVRHGHPDAVVSGGTLSLGGVIHDISAITLYTLHAVSLARYISSSSSKDVLVGRHPGPNGYSQSPTQTTSVKLPH